MANKLFTVIGGVAYDAMKTLTTEIISGAPVNDQEGDFQIIGGVAYPILRDPRLYLGIRLTGASMRLIFNYNDTLKSNPTIVIMGSSHSISLGLTGPQTLQYKLQQYFNANWGGATIHNIGVAGEYTDHWLPTVQGGNPALNVDAALSYNPDIVLVIGPTNDAQFNTPAQSAANYEIIGTYLREHGAIPFIHSPLPRGSYGAPDQQDLADSDITWNAKFPYLYFSLFNSVLRDDTAPTAAEPNLFFYQGDETHLNDAGTTVQANAITPVLEYQLRTCTAYHLIRIQKSANGTTGWSTWDDITNLTLIRKDYTKEVGYYRAVAQDKAGNFIPVSNVVQVTNLSPSASAGVDQNLSEGTTTTNVTGVPSDPDGSIVSVIWTQVAGDAVSLVNANTNTVTVNGMANGKSYTLRFTVTDNAGGTAFDEMIISVASAGNVSPTANAGTDVDYVFGTTTGNLTGSGSDSDGTITGYAWTQISGPNTAGITSASSQNSALTGLIGGVYVFRLTVTDNNGATGTDDVRIRVVSKIAKFNISKAAYAVTGYTNVFGDPTNNNATANATDAGTGFYLGARAAANWNNTVGGENSKDGWGEVVDDGGGFTFSPNDAIINYWYNVIDAFDGTKYQILLNNLDVTKQYRIRTLASRSNANGATGPYSTAFNLLTGTGNVQVITTNTYRNTSKVAEFTNVVPLGGGSLQLALHHGASGTVAHINVLTIEQF